MSWYLVANSGPSSGSAFELMGPSITIGREADNDIVIDDNMVSRHHARLEMQGDIYILTDLASANGTWVNDRRISEPVSLQANDSIRFGKWSVFVFSARPFLGGDETFVAEDMIPERAPRPPAAAVRPQLAAGGGLVCAACGQPNRPGVRFCGHCGQSISVSPAPRQTSGLPGWALAVGGVLMILVCVLVAALIALVVLPSRVEPTPSLDVVRSTLPPITAIPLDPTPTPVEALAPTFTPVLPEPPLYPPPLGKIVFASNRDDPSGTLARHTRTGELLVEKDLYLMNADGSGLVKLTDEARDNANCRWSPDAQRIVFVSTRDGNLNVFVMNADGSAVTRLTDDPARDLDPTWSPDGQRIAFCSDRDGNQEIYVMNADGSGQIRITNNPATDYLPDWSPDGEWIAFGSKRDGNEDIYLMRPDGSQVTKLTQDPATDYHPSWSPDGKRIVFSSGRDGNYEVYVMNADGSDPVRLTDDPARDMAPRWSPDGNYIVFHREVDDNWETFIMRADGSEQRNITNNLFRDTDSDWAAGSVPPTDTPTSPTDTPVPPTDTPPPPTFTPTVPPPTPTRKPAGVGQIAFVSNRDGNDEIYVMNPDGSNQRRLTNTPGEDWHPAWSPDGSKILFACYREGVFNACVVNADGSGYTQLTYLPASVGQVYRPVWSPDGQRFAFTRDLGGAQTLVTAGADGKDHREVADLATQPHWSPDGSKIAFIRYRDWGLQIWTVSPDGSDERMLTQGNHNHMYPTWSPDGSQIAFEYDHVHVAVMDAGGGPPRIVADKGSHNLDWSSDGSKLVISPPGEGIWVVNVDGSGLTQIAQEGELPSWQAVP